MNDYILAYLGVLIGTIIKVVVEWQKGNGFPPNKRVVGLIIISLFIGSFIPLFADEMVEMVQDKIGLKFKSNPIVQLSSIIGLASENILSFINDAIITIKNYGDKWLGKKLNNDG